MPRFVRCLCIFFALAVSVLAQEATPYPHKATPVKIDKHLLLFPDAIVLEQWPHTLSPASPPQNLKMANPGQCMRVGIIATGDDRDNYLAKTQLSYRVEFAGQSQNHPLEPLAAIKRIKPQGTDFVNAMLMSADVPPPDMAMASIGASAESWCVPADAQDGTATIDAEAETPDGHKKLASAKIQIESFESGTRRLFKDTTELDAFAQGYHWQPNPARLYPDLLFYSADKNLRSQTGSLETTATFISSGLKANPAAAHDFMTRIAAQSGFTRAFGLLILLNSGDDVDPVLKTMSDADQKMFANHPVLPDPFDLTHVEDIGTRLDMLWSIFMSTGQLAPMQKIASTFAWRNDWEEFDKARKSANPPKEWTSAIGRAVGYGAAGWAMGSFQRTDPLAADYIEFMIASPDTPDPVKAELKMLQFDPAFKYPETK